LRLSVALLALHCKQATSQQSCCRSFKPMGLMLYQTIKSDVRQKICIAQLRRFHIKNCKFILQPLGYMMH
ncbi:MAG: hypothetical protein RR625_05605, partial [Christensenellaceae bacterium]